jgi:hypothetical protein
MSHQIPNLKLTFLSSQEKQEITMQRVNRDLL